MIKLSKKEISKILHKQKPIILHLYSIEYTKEKKNYFWLLFTNIEFASSLTLFVGICVFFFVNFNDNPLIEHVDAGALFEGTASQVNTNLIGGLKEGLTEEEKALDDSILRIEYAISYAKKNNLKEYYSTSKVDYISTLEMLRDRLYSLKMHRMANFSSAQNQIPLVFENKDKDYNLEIREIISTLVK